MRYLLILFLLITSNVWALPQLPDVASDVALTALQQAELKGNLKGKIFKELMPIKDDYFDHYNRGTVEFNPKKGVNYKGREVFEASNYSFHKVTIPDGTTIHNINFSQRKPHTNAINGEHLHFIDCNLNNVEIDSTWTFKRGLRIHSKYEIVTENEKTYNVYYVEKDGTFEEISREEIITE